MQKHIFLSTIENYGGSFHRSLANALKLADPMNYKRILEAFPELEKRYGFSSQFYQETKEKLEQERLKDQKIFSSMLLV